MTASRSALMTAVLAPLLAVAPGCGDAEEAAPAPPVEDKCPKVDMDKLSGKWIKVKGKAADKNFRFEFVKKGDGAELWYTGGGFRKRRLAGERRPEDWRFTEQLGPEAEKRYAAGDLSKVRLFVAPSKKTCSLRVTEVELSMAGGKEKEKPKGTFVEFLEFPKGPTLTFQACDGPLFLGDAAKDPAVAARQLSETGSPEPGHSLGEAIPVGVWTDAAADGDASCTYDMDLYFDDQVAKLADKSPRPAVAAGAVVDGKRPWLVSDWYAPYSGNHHFQIYRHRTCNGTRELVDVRCLEAVLD